MLAAHCSCAAPQVFDPGTCHTCGRAVPQRVTASTWKIALAISHFAVGHRRTGHQTGHHEEDTHG